MTSLTSIIENEFTNFYIDDDHELGIKYINKKHKQFCINCGKYNHPSGKCPGAITSLGVINIYLGDDILEEAFKNKYVIENVKDRHKHLDNDYKIRQILISKFNNKNDEQNTSNIDKFISDIAKQVKVLLICRKNSVGYIELIRGKYDETNSENILYLLNQMTPTELTLIKTLNFNQLWNNLWNGKYDELTDINYINKLESDYLDITTCISDQINDDLTTKDTYYLTKMHKEYIAAKNKHELLTSNKLLTELCDKVVCSYDEPEWGFPKGRRNPYENNIDCAMREFREETLLEKNKLTILDRLIPISESLIGTNNINYRHTYYISISKQEKLTIADPNQAMEIGNIGWFTLDEARKLIRPYHQERLNIINIVERFIAHNLRFYKEHNHSVTKKD